MDSTLSKRLPFKAVLNLGNKKKSAGAKSGEYGGCGMTVVLVLAKNCCTNKEL
ncbi:hypothetical protein GCM10010230_68520 [Streptomyces narbonensis]|nr:hypothetical protein GCM10010230_68520 [Streptomyces narbonensis]